MVTDVYAEIVDEDRRLNAEKMNKDFYDSLTNIESMEINPNENKDAEKLLITLLKTLDIESLSKETKEMLLNQIQ